MIRKLLAVVAFATLALSGCSDAPEEKASPRETQPRATQTAPARPAPQPSTQEIDVPNAEINAGKNEWVAAQATQHNISIAEVERRARFMRATPNMKVTVCGRSVAFTKTIWHSCEEALKETRALQAQATARATAAPSTPRVAVVPKTTYDKLIAENTELRKERNTLVVICAILLLVLAILFFSWLSKQFSRPAGKPAARSSAPTSRPTRPLGESEARAPDSERQAPEPRDFT